MTKLLVPGTRRNRLWFPVRGSRGQGIQSGGTYQTVQHLNIMVDADFERRAKHAVIAFPLEGMCYIVEDVQQLRGIIEKLQNIERQITGKGESKVVAFDNRPDWES